MMVNDMVSKTLHMRKNINKIEVELTVPAMVPVARRAGCSSAETEAISITAATATEIRETFIMTMMNRLIVGYYYLSTCN